MAPWLLPALIALVMWSVQRVTSKVALAKLSTPQSYLLTAVVSLPIYLPVTTTTRGHSLEVWGCVRPAHYATVDSAQTQVARVLFAPGHTQAFRTLSTVTIANPRGYFDVRVTLPSSGSVKLAWTYPLGDALLFAADDRSPAGTVFSRTVNVNVR